MSYQTTETSINFDDPLDVIEAVAHAAEINYERIDDTEAHLSVKGGWGDLTIWFAWRPEFQTIQVGATLDIKVAKEKLKDAAMLLALINERLWIGHFDLWSDDGVIVYRHAAVLSEDGEIDRDQAEILIQGALDSYERFYPAFQFLVDGGKSPEDALEAALFDTLGTA